MARLFLEVARRSFRRSSRYRAATAAGVFVNTFFGYVRASILVFIAEANGGSLRGMSTEQLATFAFVSQAFIMVIGAFGDTELAERIRSGDVVIDLYRPADFQFWWLATWMGKSAFQLLGRGIPPIVLGAIAFDLVWPDPTHLVPFAFAVVCATTIGFGLRFLTNLVTFWLLDNQGIEQTLTMLIAFFAGMLLPINFFPSWLEGVARVLPFAAMMQLPAEIYLGLHQGSDLVFVLALQAAWAVGLLLTGRLVLRIATRRVVIQGG